MPGRKSNKNQSFFDYTLLFVVIFLIAFGLIMIYSTSSYEATGELGDSTYYLRHQFTATLAGVVVMVLTILVDYHRWEKYAFVGMAVSIVLIFLVLTPMGVEVNGARRWIRVAGFLQFQPAEIVKIAVILFCASMITHFSKKKLATLLGALVVIAAPAIMAVLLWKVTDNLSSGIIVGGIAIVMLFVADSDYKKYIVVVLAAVALGFILVYAATHIQSDSFRMGRIAVWLDPEKDPDGIGFQTLQALYAIGSGGVFGKGLGGSMQKLGFLPEAQNDMIFSIICEELGLFGAIAVLMMFILLIWRCMIIANNAPDLFGALLVVGVMGHIAIQVILNVAVVTNTIPNTGISLPFISYGGSSVMFLLAEIGIVFSVGRGIRLKDL